MLQFQSQDYDVGEKVEVLAGDPEEGNWIGATVTKSGPTKVYKVRYTGSGKEYDMHLDVSELQTPEGQPIQFPDNIRVHSKVKGSFMGTYYDATVLSVEVGIARVSPDGYPAGFSCWCVSHEIRKVNQDKKVESTVQQTATSHQEDNSNDVGLQVGEKITFKHVSGRKLGGAVFESNRRKVYKVTYDGWSKVYDEYVESKQCNLLDGTEVTDHTDIKKGDKMKVKWGDGGIYTASVLNVDEGVARVLPDGYPKGYEIWITADDIVSQTKGGGTASSVTDITKDELKKGQKVTFKHSSGRRLGGVVFEPGPKKVIKVTYDGWPNSYDEYVESQQCKLLDGTQVTENTDIKIGDKVKVKWGDGSIYPASVLDVRQGVAKILPDGYPKGYEIWITADELVNNLNTSQMTASTVAATSGTMEGIMQQAMNSVTQELLKYQQQGLEVKRKDEIPTRKYPSNSTPKLKKRESGKVFY